MLEQIANFKKALEALSWFTTLGANDTKHVRDEILDLLHHSSKSLKTLNDLAETLEPVIRKNFNKEFFRSIYFHCLNNFTNPEAAKQARTHCTDIARDINRISFKISKFFRTERDFSFTTKNVQDSPPEPFKNIDEAFQMLMDGDKEFLIEFEKELNRIGNELQETFNLLFKTEQVDEAWEKYDKLSKSILDERQNLKKEIEKMEKAENHIRRILT